MQPHHRRLDNFNPHEREARDDKWADDLSRLMYFNPHEREARDVDFNAHVSGSLILIHTSVKLVTGRMFPHQRKRTILIHTSVKLVTQGVYIRAAVNVF